MSTSRPAEHLSFAHHIDFIYSISIATSSRAAGMADEVANEHPFDA